MADPESQNTPLAPPSVPKSNDQLYAAGITPFRKRKHEESSKCLVYVLAAVVFVGVIFLIFGSVFLRVVNPKLRLTSVVEIQNFQSVNTNTSQSLNVTMLTRVTVINGNFGRYDFENCNAVVLYRGYSIGSGEVSGGKVGARSRKSMSVTMRIGTENLNVTDSIFNNNNNTEVVEISGYAEMTGRVRVMKIVDRRKTIEMNCTMELNLVRRSVRISLCA